MNKYVKLILSLFFDGLGMLSFILPLIGESFDVVWAPVSGLLIYKMYGGTVGKVSAFISIVEEILPFSDFVPTFTLTWIYTYLIKKRSSDNPKITP